MIKDLIIDIHPGLRKIAENPEKLEKNPTIFTSHSRVQTRRVSELAKRFGSYRTEIAGRGIGHFKEQKVVVWRGRFGTFF